MESSSWVTRCDDPVMVSCARFYLLSFWSSDYMSALLKLVRGVFYADNVVSLTLHQLRKLLSFLGHILCWMNALGMMSHLPQVKDAPFSQVRHGPSPPLFRASLCSAQLARRLWAPSSPWWSLCTPACWGGEFGGWRLPDTHCYLICRLLSVRFCAPLKFNGFCVLKKRKSWSYYG